MDDFIYRSGQRLNGEKCHKIAEEVNSLVGKDNHPELQDYLDDAKNALYEAARFYEEEAEGIKHPEERVYY